MQRAFGRRKRVRQIERGKRGVAGFADDPLRLDDKGVQSRQITLWAIDRGLGSGLAEKDGVSGDARRLLAAEPPDRMQREVHPGERRPGGRDTPILDERRAARDIGARIAALELVQPPRGRRAAPTVEKSRLAQEEGARSRAANQRAARVLAPQPRGCAGKGGEHRGLTAVFGVKPRHENRVASADFLQRGRDGKDASCAVDDGRAAGAGGQSEERRTLRLSHASRRGGRAQGRRTGQ